MLLSGPSEKIIPARVGFEGVGLDVASARPQVTGFYDDPFSTRCSGRRPKSAKARNRGMWGTGGAAGAMKS